MHVESASSMTDAPFSSVSPQRKVIAMGAAACFVVSLGLAFVLTGKKTHAPKIDSSDTQIGTLTGLAVVDLSSQPTPNDWFDGVPDGIDARAKPSVEASAAGKAASTVVTGDSDAAIAAVSKTADSPLKVSRTAPAAAGPQPAPAAAPVVSVQAQPSKAPAPAAVPSTPQPLPVISAAPAPPPPPAAVVSAAQSAVVNPPAAPAPAARQPSGGTSPTSAIAADLGLAAKPSATGPQPTEGKMFATRRQEPRPLFALPPYKQPGLLAQTLTLITEAQFRHLIKPPAPQDQPPVTKPQEPAQLQDAPKAAPPLVSAAAAGVAEEPVPKAIPVHVLHEPALVYAAQATRPSRQQAIIDASGHMRLTKRADTPNSEDKPAAPRVKRPLHE